MPSFPFFREQSVTYRILNLLINLCCYCFPNYQSACHGILIVEGSSFWGVFLDQGDLYFGHPFGYICFFLESIYFVWNSVMDRSEFLKLGSMQAIMAGWFTTWFFLECCFMCVEAYIALGLSNLNSFVCFQTFRLFLLCTLRSYILLQNCFASFGSSCWYVSPFLLVKFLSLFCNILGCSWYLLI